MPSNFGLSGYGQDWMNFTGTMAPDWAQAIKPAEPEIPSVRHAFPRAPGEMGLDAQKKFSFLMFVFTLVETGEKGTVPIVTIPTG